MYLLLILGVETHFCHRISQKSELCDINRIAGFKFGLNLSLYLVILFFFFYHRIKGNCNNFLAIQMYFPPPHNSDFSSEFLEVVRITRYILAVIRLVRGGILQ